MNRARHQVVAAVIALLVEAFPRCFSIYEGRRRPLKLKIDLDILTALNGAVTPAELQKALGAYTSNSSYLGHILKGAWRVDLAGEPAGVVTADEEAHAKAALARIRAKEKKRTAQAKVQTQAPPAKRLSLADLKAAAVRRKLSVSKNFGPALLRRTEEETCPPSKTDMLKRITLSQKKGDADA